MGKLSLEHPNLQIRRAVFSSEAEFRELQNLARDLRIALQTISDAVNYVYDGLQLPSYTVAGVPSASDWVRRLIYVSDETGGAVPAFSDGTNWRRVTDRAIIS